MESGARGPGVGQGNGYIQGDLGAGAWGSAALGLRVWWAQGRGSSGVGRHIGRRQGPRDPGPPESVW